MDMLCRATAIPLILASTLAVATSAPRPAEPLAVGILERFDILVGETLPATMAFPMPAQGARSREVSSLVVTSRLRSTVIFPGEPPSLLYDATLDGNAAIVTRSLQGLDVTTVAEDGIHITAVSDGKSEPEYSFLRAPPVPMQGQSAAMLRKNFEGDLVHPRAPPEPMPLADSSAPHSIQIFLHDELRFTQARSIHAGFVAWWLRDMTLNVIPDERIEVTYLQPISGLSDMVYGDPDFVHTWDRAVDAYVTRHGLRRTWKNRYLLVTKRNPAEGYQGQAIPGYGVAVAGISGSYDVIAHELGHTFGAEHEFAEWRAQGWWPCQTNMYAGHVPFLSSCYEYSAANVANIRRYVEL